MTFGSGTGPGVDGLTAAVFAGGQFLMAGTNAFSGSAPTTFALGCEFNTTTTPGAFGATLTYSQGWALYIDSTGHLNATGPGFAGLTGGAAVVDGSTHLAIVQGGGGTSTLYLDGVAVASTATGSGTMQGYTSVGATTGGGAPFTGTISHVAVWPSGLTAANVTAIYTAGGASEYGTVCLARLAGYAGVPVGSLDTSLTNVPAQATNGKSAFEAMLEVADAEFGLVFVDGSGSLTFHNRNRVAVKTVPDLILDRQWVTPDVQPVLDDQRIINYVEVTAEGTGSLQLVRDTPSETTHGRYPDSRSYLVRTDSEALSRANWIIGNFAEPTPRYGTLTINLYGMTASMANAVLGALDLNCWLRVTSLASQNPGGATADVVVQGWREEATAESWTITCNVIARSLFQAALWDDPGSLWDSAVWAI